MEKDKFGNTLADLESAKRHNLWTDTKVTWYDLDTFMKEAL